MNPTNNAKHKNRMHTTTLISILFLSVFIIIFGKSQAKPNIDKYLIKGMIYMLTHYFGA